MENGQFHLGGSDGDPDALERGLDAAAESCRFVGASGSLVTVVTCAEDSAGTPITIEVCAGVMGLGTGPVRAGRTTIGPRR